MKRTWLKIELLSDAVVTADASTQGEHEALDFLPGSLFRGAVIGRLGKNFEPKNFFSAKIRFNNAYPIFENNIQSFPMPLSFHRLKTAPNEVYNGITTLPQKQVQQMRGNYLTMDGKEFQVSRNYRMKTAIDRNSGYRSTEGQLFGYDAICSGTVFATQIDFDESISDNEKDKIIHCLLNTNIRLGKSRSAEYGKVRISLIDEVNEPESCELNDSLVLYLASDLALEHNGIPITTLTPKLLGLPVGLEIDFGKSFVRTRKYSPWNAYFATRMRERHVICRGSVIKLNGTCKLDEIAAIFQNGYGLYREEGLGKILVNPEFVCKLPKTIEKAQPIYAVPEQLPITETVKANDAILFEHLAKQARMKNISTEAQKTGKKWIDMWFKHFKDADFPGKSQWGSIRKIAAMCGTERLVLTTELDKFCARGTRQRFWHATKAKINNDRKTLLEVIKEAISSHEKAEIAVGALYYAATEAPKKLASQKIGGGKS